MTPERWQRIKVLLADALERSPAERAAFLDEACGSDAALRAEVESLLAYEDAPGADDPLADVRAEAAATVAETPTDELRMAGRCLGPYEIVREIGRGGMSVVYLARRVDEYRQQVAIKLLRRGMDTELVLHRFRNERQILASLDHPNIARLLDGGTTEDGAPYLVMEYIEGLPIHEYCDDHKLSTEDRLRLFRQVCAAVQYAHQRLVIHRDIKPSNILVGREGKTKLLDFGIAKILTPELAAQTLDQTSPALRLMTPAYASPEQIRGDAITTASDVYSLGVVLYELLTGHKPYRVTSESPHELMRAVLEEEPRQPSTAVTLIEEVRTADGTSRLTLTPESVSQTREGSPEKLRRRLKGDLDNIVLKALCKEPERRYASVEQFSEDIRRHLEGLPVIARPATLSYRAGKFIRRHKAGVAAAVAIVGILVAAIIAINHQRARAERRFNEVRKLARTVVFDYHDAIADLPGATLVRQRLVKDALEYLDSLAKEAAGDRTLQRELAAAYIKIGDVQGNSRVANLGDMSGALASYRKALTIRQALARAEPANVEVQSELAESYDRIGTIFRDMGDVTGAAGNYQQAMMVLEKLSASAPENVALRRKLAAAYVRMGDIKAWPRSPNLGDNAGGIELYRKALALREALCAARPTDIELRAELQETHQTLADVLLSNDKLTDAEPHARRAVALAESRVAADPTSVRARRALMRSQDALANWLERRGEVEKALALYRQLLASAEALVAADPNNMQARMDLAARHTRLGRVFLIRGDLVQSVKHFRQALSLDEAMTRADLRNEAARRLLANDYQNLGTAQAQAGDLSDALASHRRALQYFEALMQTNPNDWQAAPRLARGYNYVGEILLKTGDLMTALDYFRRAVAVVERAPTYGSTSQPMRRQLAMSHFYIGQTYERLARRTGTPARQRSQHWRDARHAYERSLELWQEIQRQGVLPPEYASKPEETTRALARCNAALARRK
ncbi:MAG TPA: protein kinase [Blastocatellia bacterium]|nr:protein kinase [Blastocatellia bacterium]